MKKLVVIIFCLFAFTFKNNAQYNFELGFNVGGTGYLGEIGGTGLEAKGFLGDIILKETNLTTGVFGKFKITPKLLLSTGIKYVKISGDDLNTWQGPRYWRNLRFQNTIYEFNTRAEYTFFKLNDLGGRGRYTTSL